MVHMLNRSDGWRLHVSPPPETRHFSAKPGNVDHTAHRPEVHVEVPGRPQLSREWVVGLTKRVAGCSSKRLSGGLHAFG